MTDFITIRDAATVQRLARIIRDGTAAECAQAFHDVTDGRITVEMWDAAMALVDARAEADNTEGGS